MEMLRIGKHVINILFNKILNGFNLLHLYAELTLTENDIERELSFNHNSTILNIGCGNSSIANELYELGYHNIFNNDVSPTVINQMQTKNKYSSVIYEVMDVRKMRYDSGSFDMVLDKSTLDVFMCSDHPILFSSQLLDEVYRVLKMNGVYFVISYGSPFTRLEHLKRKHVAFDITCKEIKSVNEGNIKISYLYLCKKLAMKELNEEEKEIYMKELEEIEQKEYGKTEF